MSPMNVPEVTALKEVYVAIPTPLSFLSFTPGDFNIHFPLVLAGASCLLVPDLGQVLTPFSRPPYLVSYSSLC